MGADAPGYADLSGIARGRSRFQQRADLANVNIAGIQCSKPQPVTISLANIGWANEPVGFFN